jgi:hypothetical protein
MEHKLLAVGLATAIGANGAALAAKKCNVTGT